jgi:hypothetical protein
MNRSLDIYLRVEENPGKP